MKINIFGDSIFKGVQLDSGMRYAVNDGIGFNEIAAKAGMTVRNLSKFGCTITKAWNYVQKMFSAVDADIVFMNFGGNDSDFNWAAISENPLDFYGPNTEFYDFTSTYNDMVDFFLKQRRLPVVSTLVPVQTGMYVDHLCGTMNLDRENIRKWIDREGARFENSQAVYSDAVKGVAAGMNIPLIDVRAAFNDCGNVSALMCPDGIHPNSKGQKVIHECFDAFMSDCLVF